MTDRYVVPAHGPDEGQLRVALLAAVKLSEKHECAITILVPTLRNAPNTILEDVLGEALLRNLVKGRICSLDDRTVVMRSKRTINPHTESGVILSLWGGPEALEITDKADSAEAIVALSWIEDDTKGWIEKWKPVTLDLGEA